MSNLSQVEVVLSDVFGTVVDWRGSLIRQLEAMIDSKPWNLDPAGFAHAPVEVIAI